MAGRAQGRHGRLNGRIIVTVLLVVVSAVALTSILNILRLQEALQGLIAGQLAIIAKDVQATIQSGLDLGLPVNAMGNLPGILERYGGDDPRITAITVHDCAGLPVVRYPPDSGTAPADRPWMDHLQAGQWQVFRGDQVAFGLSFRDSLGQCAGGLAIAYDSAAYRGILDGAVRSLAGHALWALMVALVGIGLAIWHLKRRERTLPALIDDLRALEAQAPQGLPPPAPLIATSSDRLVTAYRAARPTLAAALAEAGRDVSPSPPPPPPPPPSPPPPSGGADS